MRSDRRLRVLYVPQWYPPKEGSNQVSGVFCREHVRAAAQFDDVAVLVYGMRPQRWPSLRWERVDDQGVPTFYASCGHSPMPRTSMPFFRIQLRRAIQRAIREWGRPDVIHTQDAYAYYVIRGVQSLGIPFVISQHWTGFGHRQLTRQALRQFRWAFARAARVLPANQRADADYEPYGLQAAITWVPNTLDTDLFWPPTSGEREPWLLHASGFTAQKRFQDIVAAFAQVRALRPAAVLQIAGDGVLRSEMEALAARELAPGSFHFHGFLSKAALADLMRRARGFVFPSAFETFGCVLMEAMACGCAVLTTSVGGIPAVVSPGDGLLVEVGNIDQITAGMLHLLDGTHGIDRERVSRETRERFSHEAVGRILHEVYGTTVRSRARPLR
jgi:glycosyltransferase involved in cell wall biosynthesis